jgi:hypothetical protein
MSQEDRLRAIILKYSKGRKSVRVSDVIQQMTIDEMRLLNEVIYLNTRVSEERTQS